MKLLLPALLALAALPLPGGQADWTPTQDATQGKDLAAIGRSFDVYKHDTKEGWGYKAPQKDVFVVVHPKEDRRNAPLYVVLHSAGHNVMSCVKCTAEVGNHDIYRSPDDFYALYLDCAANRGDWWWGGMHVKDEALIRRNSGGDPTPVERRVIDSVKWVIKTYAIDPDRVYLCGNSMGGSGTLGIGMRHGDVFAAIKANVPAGIEQVSNRMYFPPQSVPPSLRLPDPPVAVDYSAPNDGWSFGHDRFVNSMNERKYALYFYWGPFGHANNSAAILKVNDLINSFDWLSVRRNEAYPVFANASGNSKLPWPDHLKETAPGQVNAFFRWKNISDSRDKLEMSLFLTSPADLKTTLEMPKEATADVSLRRLQNLQVKPGESVQWAFGTEKGELRVDAEGVITLPGLRIAPLPKTLTVRR
jgi:pimeloyl-ACP methyl ester carboxylesterase